MSLLSWLRGDHLIRETAAILNAPIELREAAGLTPVAWTIGRPTWPEFDAGAYHRDAFAISAVVYACVTYRARCLSAATVRVYRGDGPDREPDDAHDLRALMRHPSPFLSEAEFLYVVSIIADVTNLCVIEKERDRAGNVVALHPLRTDWLKPKLRDQAAPDWEYRVPGHPRPFALAAEDVIVHTVGASATMPAAGFGPMSAIFREASVDKAMTDYLKAFFDSGGLPPYALVPQDAANLRPQDATLLREKWRQMVAQREPPILAGIKGIERVGFDFDELAFPELREMTEKNVCAAFAVPGVLIGLAGGTDASTYNNTKNFERQFYHNTIRPLWVRLDGALTRGLLPEFGERDLNLEFDTSAIEAMQDDRGPELARTVELWRYRVIRRDEARTAFGYDALGGDLGESLYTPSPVDANLDGVAEE